MTTATAPAKARTSKTAGSTRARRPAQPKRLPRAASHGSRVVEALEAAWAAIRKHHPEVPPAVVVTGSGHMQKGMPKLGHHWADAWVTDPKTGQRAPELFVAGELLANPKGGRVIVETLLHEAAHALAHARGIKDTSAEGNRYHNKEFARLAEELGLARPDRPAKVIGFSECLITDTTAAKYAAVIEAIEKARLPYLAAMPLGTGTAGTGGEDGDGETAGEEEGKKRGGRRRAAECACPEPRRIQLTIKQLEAGPIICGVCNAQFAPPVDDEDDAENGSGN